MYEWHSRLGRKKPITPNRSRTYDLLVISSHALPLSDRRETRGSMETFKVSVKENEVPTEKNSSRASIFATKASYISN